MLLANWRQIRYDNNKECDKMLELEENTKLLQALKQKIQELGESL